MYKRAVKCFREVILGAELDDRRGKKSDRRRKHRRCDCHSSRTCCHPAKTSVSRTVSRPSVMEIAQQPSSSTTSQPEDRIRTRSASRAIGESSSGSSQGTSSKSANQSCSNKQPKRLVTARQKASKSRGVGSVEHLDGHLNTANLSDSESEQPNENNCDEQSAENDNCARTRPYKQRLVPSLTRESSPYCLPRIKLYRRPRFSLQLPFFSPPIDYRSSSSSSSPSYVDTEEDEQDSDGYHDEFSDNPDEIFSGDGSPLASDDDADNYHLRWYLNDGEENYSSDEGNVPDEVNNYVEEDDDNEDDSSSISFQESGSISSSALSVSDDDSEGESDVISTRREARPRISRSSCALDQVESNSIAEEELEEDDEEMQQPVARRLRSKFNPTEASTGGGASSIRLSSVLTERSTDSGAQLAYVQQRRRIPARGPRQMLLSSGNASEFASAAPSSTEQSGPVEKKSRRCCCSHRRNGCQTTNASYRRYARPAYHPDEAATTTGKRRLATAPPRVVELDNNGELYSSASSIFSPPSQVPPAPPNFIGLPQQLLADRLMIANSMRSSLPLGASRLLSGGPRQALQHFRMLTTTSRRSLNIDTQNSLSAHLPTNKSLFYQRNLSSFSTDATAPLESVCHCVLPATAPKREAFQLPETQPNQHEHHIHKRNQNQHQQKREQQKRKRKRDSLESESSEATSPVRLRSSRDPQLSAEVAVPSSSYTNLKARSLMQTRGTQLSSSHCGNDTDEDGAAHSSGVAVQKCAVRAQDDRTVQMAYDSRSEAAIERRLQRRFTSQLQTTLPSSRNVASVAKQRGKRAAAENLNATAATNLVGRGDYTLNCATPGAAVGSSASATQCQAETSSSSVSGETRRRQRPERGSLNGRVSGSVDSESRGHYSSYRRAARQLEALKAEGRLGRHTAAAESANVEQPAPNRCECHRRLLHSALKKRRRRQPNASETEKYHQHIYSYILRLPLPRVLLSYLNYDRKS